MSIVDGASDVGVVLGAGGERAIAWEVGVLAGLADEGLDLRDAPVILGTSAGALVAARLAGGADPREDAAAHESRPVDAEPARVDDGSVFDVFAAAWADAGADLGERRRAFGAAAVAAGVNGEEADVAWIAERLVDAQDWPAALRIATIDAERGRRLVLDAGYDVALARAVAASRAIPTLKAPVRVAGRACVDGALGSATNADALLPHRLHAVLVITPGVQAPAPGTAELLWADALEDEVERLRAAGRLVIVMRAGPEDLDAMGPDPFSGARARKAVRAGRTRGRELAPALVR
ncbi:MAG: patatin-like phospholipase family protein [Solirubrobacteraceae bacterium]|nr:patatin-like phospholipase family protein [Solirubrobacteraceae bacterium]